MDKQILPSKPRRTPRKRVEESADSSDDFFAGTPQLNRSPMQDMPKKGSGFLKGLTWLIVLAAIVFGVWYWYTAPTTIPEAPAPAASEISLAEALEKVGKLVDLPPGETPSFIVVSDLSEVASLSNIQNVQVGDYVLIYDSSQKAIVYRPTTDAIVEIVSTEPANSTATSTPTTAATTTPPSILILNGTSITGLAAKTEDQLKKAGIEFTTAGKGNAKGKYTSTLIIDVSGKYTSALSAVSEAVKGNVGNLPDAEAIPEADILIIVGQ
jgi:hypothetical protein